MLTKVLFTNSKLLKWAPFVTMILSVTPNELFLQRHSALSVSAEHFQSSDINEFADIDATENIFGSQKIENKLMVENLSQNEWAEKLESPESEGDIETQFDRQTEIETELMTELQGDKNDKAETRSIEANNQSFSSERPSSPETFCCIPFKNCRSQENNKHRSFPLLKLKSSHSDNIPRLPLLKSFSSILKSPMRGLSSKRIENPLLRKINEALGDENSEFELIQNYCDNQDLYHTCNELRSTILKEFDRSREIVTKLYERSDKTPNNVKLKAIKKQTKEVARCGFSEGRTIEQFRQLWMKVLDYQYDKIMTKMEMFARNKLSKQELTTKAKEAIAYLDLNFEEKQYLLTKLRKRFPRRTRVRKSCEKVMYKAVKSSLTIS